MFDPSQEDGCPSCSAGADEVSRGLVEHLHTRDTELVYVSRAPIEKLERWKAKKGWFVPWYSSYGSDFNYDFDVTLDASVKPPVYNYRDREAYERAGSEHPFDYEQPTEMPGHELLPARRRPRLPHLLVVRARRRDDRRLVLLPRPDGARSPGGVGGAEGPRRRARGRRSRTSRAEAARSLTDVRRCRAVGELHLYGGGPQEVVHMWDVSSGTPRRPGTSALAPTD